MKESAFEVFLVLQLQTVEISMTTLLQTTILLITEKILGVFVPKKRSVS